MGARPLGVASRRSRGPAKRRSDRGLSAHLSGFWLKSQWAWDVTARRAPANMSVACDIMASCGSAPHGESRRLLVGPGAIWPGVAAVEGLPARCCSVFSWAAACGLLFAPRRQRGGTGCCQCQRGDARDRAVRRNPLQARSGQNPRPWLTTHDTFSGQCHQSSHDPAAFREEEESAFGV